MFKKTLVAVCTAALLMGCADSKVINGVKYDSIGAFDDPAHCIDYDVIVGNVVWSILLAETVVMPVYFIGFSIKEPVGYDHLNCPLKEEAITS